MFILCLQVTLGKKALPQGRATAGKLAASFSLWKSWKVSKVVMIKLFFLCHSSLLNGAGRCLNKRQDGPDGEATRSRCDLCVETGSSSSIGTYVSYALDAL